MSICMSVHMSILSCLLQLGSSLLHRCLMFDGTGLMCRTVAPPSAYEQPPSWLEKCYGKVAGKSGGVLLPKVAPTRIVVDSLRLLIHMYRHRRQHVDHMCMDVPVPLLNRLDESSPAVPRHMPNRCLYACLFTCLYSCIVGALKVPLLAWYKTPQQQETIRSVSCFDGLKPQPAKPKKAKQKGKASTGNERFVGTGKERFVGTGKERFVGTGKDGSGRKVIAKSDNVQKARDRRLTIDSLDKEKLVMLVDRHLHLDKPDETKSGASAAFHLCCAGSLAPVPDPWPVSDPWPARFQPVLANYSQSTSCDFRSVWSVPHCGGTLCLTCCRPRCGGVSSRRQRQRPACSLNTRQESRALRLRLDWARVRLPSSLAV